MVYFWVFCPVLLMCVSVFYHHHTTSLVAQMVKPSAYNAGDPGSVPGSGRSAGEGNGNPLQYSCLENPMDRGTSSLQSMGSQRVGHDWVTSLSICWLWVGSIVWNSGNMIPPALFFLLKIMLDIRVFCILVEIKFFFVLWNMSLLIW